MSVPTKNWYILYTKAGLEKKVANTLSRKNIVNYFPIKRLWNGRRKLVTEPLFSSYVFVQMEDSKLQQVRGVDGVINFAYWLGKPALVHEEEIDIMKRFLNEYSSIKVEKIPFNVNGSVRVIGSPVLEQKGQVISLKNNTVKIVLPSIGYILIAELEKSNVEVITSKKQSFGILEKFQLAIS
ncbi:MAG: transcription termination/antitermination NusG family protein [Bacteroidota bacterium]